MRYQALALILAVLISSYLLRENSVFSQGSVDTNSQQATVIDTLSLDSSLKSVQQNEQEIKTMEATGTDNQTLVSSSVSEPALMSAPPAQTLTKNVIIEKPIIENATTSVNEMCEPIEAKVFIAQTVDGAFVIYEKNSQNRWPIASITKLMTAVVALENLNQSSVIEITQQDIDDVVRLNGDNTFQASDSFTVNGLVKALLMVSSNDAAYALANSLGKDTFIQKMNDKAKELSMSQTDFYEPSGLSYLNQSTAHDLYLLLMYIQKHDQLILDITRIKTLTIKNQTKGTSYKELNNINELAGRNDFLGGKTGFIDQSGGNLISLFRKNGKMVYIGVLGSPDRFGETEKILSCVQ